MTDETPQQTPGRFVIVPTAADFLDLEERVEELEARQPAIAETQPMEYTTELVGDAATVARLDRHRVEIEALKSWLNELLDALAPALATANITAPAPPALTPEDYL